MRQHLRLTLVFYRVFWVYTLAASLGLWYIFGSPMHIGFLKILPAFLLSKLATHALVLYLLHQRYASRLYFYANLGMPAMGLYVVSYVMDVLLFLSLLGILHLIL